MSNRKIKIGLIGDKNTGKASIIDVICNQKSEKEKIRTFNDFIEIKEPKIKIRDNLEVNFINTAENNELIKKTDGIFLVYSIINKKSFQNCETRLKKLKKLLKDNKIPIILLGNKCDEEEKREVSNKERLDFSNKNNLKVYECSAKKNININKIFYYLIDIILKTEFKYKPINSIGNPIIIRVLGDKSVGKTFLINNMPSKINIKINDSYISIFIKYLENNFDSNNLNNLDLSSGFIFVYLKYNLDSLKKLKEWLKKKEFIKNNIFSYSFLMIENHYNLNEQIFHTENEEGEYLSNKYLFYFSTTSDEKLIKKFEEFIKDIILLKPENYKPKTYKFDGFTIKIPSIMKNDNFEEYVATKRYSENSSYRGFFKNGKREKKGIMRYNNNNKYQGYWLNDMKNGYGIFTYNNGEVYKGYWKNDLREGKGEMRYSKSKEIKNNCIYYNGEWKDDKWNGKGKCIFENNDCYEGYFVNGKTKGKGIIKYNNGDKYEGNVDDLKKEKYGVMNYNNGDLYKGNWKNDKKNGSGFFQKNNSYIFEGYFDDDQIYNGIFFYNSSDYLLIQENNDLEKLFKNKLIKGIIKKGNFNNNELNGTSLYISPNEYFYMGNYKNNQKNGKGRIKYDNGDEYFGNWVNDKMEGFGTYKYNNGKVYSGIFHNNKFEEFKKEIVLRRNNNNNSNENIDINTPENSNENIDFFYLNNNNVNLQRKKALQKTIIK